MWLTKWLPWKFFIKRAAKAYDFLDPITLMAHLRRFGHPSEVNEPIELLRAGMIFHARGLINTRAIQYNLDWIWPYWIVKQFKPNDNSFIPRGFSFSHVNLTHRNWTAVGLPDLPYYPIVDPRGMVTPYLDGWSLEFWIQLKDGTLLVPSEMDAVRQELRLDDGPLRVETKCEGDGWQLHTAAWAESAADDFRLWIQARADTEPGSLLILALRPYNPEGIQFIHAIDYDRDSQRFQVNDKQHLSVDRSPMKTVFSNYAKGDVAHHLDASGDNRGIACSVGMATGAALFPAGEDRMTRIRVSLPLMDSTDAPQPGKTLSAPAPISDWKSRLSETARLVVPDERIQFLYDAAVRTILLLTAEDPYPGPYTYKRFWFRDACLMIHAMLGVGLDRRARRMVANFAKRQTLTGFFRSQEGEWDANGQVLWILDRLHRKTGLDDEAHLIPAVFKGADWIINKRRKKDDAASLHDGLLPAGFSAEHLGPNDYYYWDNFWGVAGLRAAARLAGVHGDKERQKHYLEQADDFRQTVMESIRKSPAGKARGAIAAAPYRRMDAGAIGSLVADYPLRLLPPGDPLIMNTIAYLKDRCFHSGAFFQDMIHSGINAYLTLAIAQSLLRANDPGYRELIHSVADLASPTGQWPEAIHPFTKGGCMGDGQHGWATAEWLMMIRNLFVREEGETILIGSGLFTEWLDSGRELAFGPTAIPGGRLSVALEKRESAVCLQITADGLHPGIEIVAAVPGYRQRTLTDVNQPIDLEPI